MRSLLSRPIVWVAIALAAVVFLAAAWYLGSPLILNQTVDEAFPGASLPAQGSVEAAEEAMPPGPNAEDEMEGEGEGGEVAMPAETAQEASGASAEPVLLSQGDFQGTDRLHQGEGQAKIYQLEDGSHVLRFENFSVTNGPDLHVLVSQHPDPTNREEVMMGYLDLGELKGNLGDQNYTFPAGTDVSGFQSVIIYCEPFHVIFATASLSGP